MDIVNDYRAAVDASIKDAGRVGPGWNERLRVALHRHQLAVMPPANVERMLQLEPAPARTDVYPDGHALQAPAPAPDDAGWPDGWLIGWYASELRRAATT